MKKLLTIFSLLGIILSSCEGDSAGVDGSPGSSAGNGAGQGGSTARFTIMQDQLLAISEDGQRGDFLQSFSLQDPASPRKNNTGTPLRLGTMETLYPYSDSILLIGGPTGMQVVRVAGTNLTQWGNYRHVTACDPVVAKDTLAYVTLRSSTNNFCNNGINELQVLDISDWQNIHLVSSRSLNFPRGLGIYGDSVLVCDDVLRNFYYRPQDSLMEVNSLDGVQDPRDIIVLDQSVLIITDSGFKQYAIQNGGLQLLSEL